MLDVVLIAVNAPHPANVHAASAFRATPLGVAAMGATLERRGFRAALIDMNSPPCPSAWVARFVAENQPRLIGLSCSTESAGNAVRLARALRGVAPEAVIATGGPHMTFLPAEALSTGVFDAVALREGDLTVVDLAAAACESPRARRGRSRDLSDHLASARAAVPGLVVRDPAGGPPIRTPPRRLVADLDSLPFPARHLFVPPLPPGQASVLTGRGCPGRCAFCSATAMSGGRRRARSAESVVAELRLLRDGSALGIFFVDDTLTAEPELLERLLDLMEAERIGLPWVCESRADTVTPALFARMAALGCASVQFGVESGSQELLDAMGKGTTLGQIERAVGWASAAGIAPVCSFIIGQPWDSPATVAASFEFAEGLQRRYLARCGFAVLVPFPGTWLWRHGARLGLRRTGAPFDDYSMHTPVCGTSCFSPEGLRGLQFEAASRLARSVTEEVAAMLPFGPDGAGALGTASVWRDWY